MKREHFVKVVEEALDSQSHPESCRSGGGCAPKPAIAEVRAAQAIASRHLSRRAYDE